MRRLVRTSRGRFFRWVWAISSGCERFVDSDVAHTIWCCAHSCRYRGTYHFHPTSYAYSLLTHNRTAQASNNRPLVLPHPRRPTTIARRHRVRRNPRLRARPLTRLPTRNSHSSKSGSPTAPSPSRPNCAPWQ
jgi:hypothetical protein